ncbi:hypothetical protein [Gottfriedia acidiceleris]|uniref:hypothetical protein n=1 Tax=Gottfriedia acidiceleris TaxID=371036 RepID=UPI002FFE0E25
MKKLRLTLLSGAILTSTIAPNFVNAEETQPVQEEVNNISDDTIVVDESDKLEQLEAEALATPETPEKSARMVVNDGYQDYSYAKTVYGTTSARDGFVAAVATTLINGLPGGYYINKAKAVWNGILVFLGFGNYTPKYLKAVIYVKNDAYYNRSKIIYYSYSDSKRTKLISKTTRYHSIQLKDYR